MPGTSPSRSTTRPPVTSSAASSRGVKKTGVGPAERPVVKKTEVGENSRVSAAFSPSRPKTSLLISSGTSAAFGKNERIASGVGLRMKSRGFSANSAFEVSG